MIQTGAQRISSSDVWLPCIPDTGEIKSFEWGDHRIKTLDIDNNYISNFMRSKMLQGNRLTQELQENNIEDDIIEVTEIVEEKDSKIRSGKVDKKNKEIKETAITEEIADPDDQVLSMKKIFTSHKSLQVLKSNISI